MENPPAVGVKRALRLPSLHALHVFEVAARLGPQEYEQLTRLLRALIASLEAEESALPGGEAGETPHGA